MLVKVLARGIESIVERSLRKGTQHGNHGNPLQGEKQKEGLRAEGAGPFRKGRNFRKPISWREELLGYFLWRSNLRAFAMEEQPRERSEAGAEACEEKRGLSQAAEERIEDRISLLLRCSRRASAPTREAQGSYSGSLADLGLRSLRHHQFHRFRPVSGEESRKRCPPRREASGLGWDILQEDVALCPS